MTNVIVIPEKQITLIHPEWSAIRHTVQPSFPQTHLAWSLKSLVSHPLHKKY